MLGMKMVIVLRVRKAARQKIAITVRNIRKNITFKKIIA
jgi:hypothetical protein